MKAILSDIWAFLRALGYIVISGISGFYIFTMIILGWPTRILLGISIGLLIVIAIRLHEKHHRSERFDDKLTPERMRSATDDYIRRWKKD